MAVWQCPSVPTDARSILVAAAVCRSSRRHRLALRAFVPLRTGADATGTGSFPSWGDQGVDAECHSHAGQPGGTRPSMEDSQDRALRPAGQPPGARQSGLHGAASAAQPLGAASTGGLHRGLSHLDSEHPDPCSPLLTFSIRCSERVKSTCHPFSGSSGHHR